MQNFINFIDTEDHPESCIHMYHLPLLYIVFTTYIQYKPSNKLYVHCRLFFRVVGEVAVTFRISNNI